MRFSWIKLWFLLGSFTACAATVSDSIRPIRTQGELVDYLHFHPPRAPSWWGGCETKMRTLPDGGNQEIICWDGSNARSTEECPPVPANLPLSY